MAVSLADSEIFSVKE